LLPRGSPLHGSLPCGATGDGETVLVVFRKPGERILIGDDIALTVVKVGGGGVRLGIDAPQELAVVREELAEQLRLAEQKQAADAAVDEGA